jgi:hypothetical protein
VRNILIKVIKSSYYLITYIMDSTEEPVHI